MRGFFTTFDRMLSNPQPSRILEIGVGEGVVTSRVIERFPGATVIGVDLPDDGLVDEWRSRHLSCAFGDAVALPFPDGAFDLVLAIEVFEHLPDPHRALAEVARVCSGALIASVPFEPIWRFGNIARGRYVRHLGNTPGHVNHWSSRSFRKLISTQFDIVERAAPLPWTMLRASSR